MVSKIKKISRLQGLLTVALTLALTLPTQGLAATNQTLTILEFELRDLTLYPQVAAESQRASMLRPMLRQYLQNLHQLQVLDNPPSAQQHAAKGAGYLFDRPALTARIGREAGARWVVSGRLHKASYLFVYLKAQLINATTGLVAADFVVEIKGAGNKLTEKGVERLASQINQAIQSML